MNVDRKKILRDPNFLDWISAGLICSAIFVATPLAVSLQVSGRTSVEKAATAMVQPLFVVWFGLIVTGLVLSWRKQKGPSRLCLLLAFFVWCVSNNLVKNWAFRKWESQIAWKPWDTLQPYDYVVVLGGSSSSRPDTSPQIGDAGDRIMTGARLFHRGLAKRLITTGDVPELTGNFGGKFEKSDLPSIQTKGIWQDLGIPAEAIDTIGGQNTSSEMAQLAKNPQWWEQARCGLVTSAMHMPRAMKLAQKNGVRIEPIPADFRGNSPDEPLTIDDFIPNAEGMRDMQHLFKEWLGMQLGR